MQQEGIYVYGSGECDQLGNIKDKQGEYILESKIPLYLPIEGITEIEKIYKISCGGMHTLLLTSQGNIYSWGCGDGGTLGRDGTDNIPTKVNINIPIEGISAGDCHSIAYNDKLNKLFFWGTFRNSQGEIGDHINTPMEINLNLIKNEYIVKVLSGNNHVVILTEQGHVYAFGNKEFGQTGIDISKIDKNRNIENEHLIPNKIKGDNIIDIYTGGNHSFLIQNDRRKIFKSWGCNLFGQLGINNTENQFEPQEVIFPEENIEIISCTGGDFHSLALTSNYHIYSWGKNDESQCGLPVVDETNAEGQVLMSCILKPTRININENDIREIDSYGNYNFAFNPENGKAYSWGFGASYVLGNKKEKNEATPFEINQAFFNNMRFKNICLGNQHVCLELEKFDKNYVKTAFEFDYAANGYSIRKKVVKRKGTNYDNKKRSNKKRRKGSKVDEAVTTEKKTRKRRSRRGKDKGKEIDSDEDYIYSSKEEDEEEDDEEEEEEEEIEKKNRRKRRNYGKKSVSKKRRKKKENNDDIEEDEEEEIEVKSRRKRRNYGKKSVSKSRRKSKRNEDIEEEEEEEEIQEKTTKRRNYGKKSVSKSRKKSKRNEDIEEDEEENEEKNTKRRNYGKKSVSKSRKKSQRNEDIEEDEEEGIEENKTKRRNYGKKSVSKPRKKTKRNEEEEEENVELKTKRRNYGKRSVSKSRKKTKENEDIEEDNEEENEEIKSKRRNYGKKSVSKSRKKIKENDDENIENEEEEEEEEEENLKIKTKKRNYGKRSVSKTRKKTNENDEENIEIKLSKEEINFTPIKTVGKNIKTTGAKLNRKTNVIEIEKTINIKSNLTRGIDAKKLNEINEEEDDSNTSETVGIVKEVKLIRYSDSDNEKKDKNDSTIKKRTYKTRSKSKSKSNVKTKEKKIERKSNRKYTNTSRSKSKSNVKKGNRSVKK